MSSAEILFTIKAFLNNTQKLEKNVSPEDSVLEPKMDLKILIFHTRVSEQTGFQKKNPKITKILKKRVPGVVTFWDPKWTSKSWFFIAKN